MTTMFYRFMKLCFLVNQFVSLLLSNKLSNQGGKVVNKSSSDLQNL